MLETGVGLLAVVALVLANGFFVASEFALVRVRRTKVDQLVEEGRTGSGSVRDAVVHLDSYIAACQLGITVASLALGWIGEQALAGLLDPLVGVLGAHAVSVTLVFVIITALHVVAGELAPKGIALQHPERVALTIAAPLRLFRALFRPAIWLLNESGWLVARAVGVSSDVSEEPHLGAAELSLAIDASTEAGELSEDDRFLMARVLRFHHLTAEQVMLPRTELLALPVTTTIDEALRFVASSRHSRYPVYGDSIDDVIGVLHVRDLVGAEGAATIRELLRQPLIVPAQASVSDLLSEMRKRKTHFAVVVDEYGGTDGIVALEDVLEEIVGELQDEFEQEPPPVERRAGGAVRFGGLSSVDVLDELLGVTAEAGPYKTVAGYLVEHIGRIPELGDRVDLDGYRLTVVEMDGMRIAMVEATPLAAPASRQAATE
ncbi:MAG: hemolysin family protein [Dehalococcoidia bacterium]|jgi:CBS domain containing-hemolysin-like protein|nr:hemolysin family protein [Dehalococcoidia bacterium]